MTDRMTLRAVLESDLPIFFDQQNDPEANQMAAFPARTHENFMAHWKKIMANESVVLRTIVCDGAVAGNIVSFEMSGAREVGYWLGRDFWGKGIATAALRLFLSEVTVRPLYAHVAKHNVGSCRVLEKCGFGVCGEDSYPSDAAPGGIAQEWILRLDGEGRS